MSLSLTKSYNDAKQLKYHMKQLLKESKKKNQVLKVYMLEEYIQYIDRIILLLEKFNESDEFVKQYEPAKDYLKTKRGKQVKRDGSG